MRRSAATVACLVLGTILALITPVPAGAEPDLTADPAPGAILTTMPAAVTLRFSADVDLETSHIAVSGPDGAGLADGEAEQPGRTVLRQPVRAGAPGDLTVAYHVIFSDGASTTGAYRFSAGTGAVPAPLDSTAERAATSAVSRHRHDIDPFSAVLLVIDGAVLVAVGGLLMLRPRHGSPVSLRLEEPR
ncbi:copper resistance CopC family protein [Actinoplanes siamensis]|uniref:CopC domain-containing protein n=1 Tax=Actinoplanes siamensis TaxID=1223317 RepID=A0A919TN96_9ACTN|nr:copper resistance CopC family protein [Actinoplanes siamensis]GIF08497.1 hypothetical protein Asi03nite_60350 [Actinoplanes siamensis]